MTMHTATAARNLGLNAEFDQANSGFLDIYSGSMPANPQTAVSGTLLSSHAMSATAFGAASGGSKTANAIGSATIQATGTAGYARLFKSDHTTAISDHDVGTSGTDVIFDSVAFQINATAVVSSFVVSRAQ